MRTELWQALKAQAHHNWAGNEDKPAGSGVNGHQFCEHFVKPWTKVTIPHAAHLVALSLCDSVNLPTLPTVCQGTGSSVALLMNAKHGPRKADVMLSHSWNELMEEVTIPT